MIQFVSAKSNLRIESTKKTLTFVLLLDLKLLCQIPLILPLYLRFNRAVIHRISRIVGAPLGGRKTCRHLEVIELIISEIFVDENSKMGSNPGVGSLGEVIPQCGEPELRYDLEGTQRIFVRIKVRIALGGLDINRLVSSCCEREAHCMRVSERSMTITMEEQGDEC